MQREENHPEQYVHTFEYSGQSEVSWCNPFLPPVYNKVVPHEEDRQTAAKTTQYETYQSRKHFTKTAVSFCGKINAASKRPATMTQLALPKEATSRSQVLMEISQKPDIN